MSKTDWKRILFGILVIAGLVFSFEMGRRTVSPGPNPYTQNIELTSQTSTPADMGDREATVKWWTCSMHPQVKLPSGDMNCPTCFMELIPVLEGGGEEGIPEISFSDRARILAEVEAAPVERKEVTKSVRLVGKIQPDETNLSMITAWVPGRLDRLFVDYTGMEVRRGDHLVEIYSPELFSAQQELLQAIISFGELKGSNSELMVNTSQSFIRLAKDKLIRLGLTQEQVEEIVRSKEPTDTLTLYSPTSGIVTARQGTEGMYVKEGSMIYTIADLSTVWLLLDAYESDMEWLHYGQSVDFETEAYPGERFAGTLSFISPVLEEQSRTVTLRVNVSNEDQRLKPGMFARAVIHAIPSSGGKIIAPEMVGKWICPMHPEVVDDGLGPCPVCEMPLETAKSLGYVTAVGQDDLPLVIPDSAPLKTGKRAVVYLEKEKEDGIYYEGKVVELGPHADGYYVVESGLEEGDIVVTKGNFKIDSALQIQAKPSMMNPDERDEAEPSSTTQSKEEYDPVEISAELSDKIKPVLSAYLDIQAALAGDSFEKAGKAADELSKACEALPDGRSDWKAKVKWDADVTELKESAAKVSEATEIEALREDFFPLSKALDGLVRHFGNVRSAPIRWAFCPMALEDGAYWLQPDETIANPYYGASMLRCGEIKATYSSRVAEKAPTP